MQVNRQPSPWPCVIMLVGLLLICLAAPSYWQDDGERLDMRMLDVTDETLPSTTLDPATWPYGLDASYAQFDNSSVGDSRLASNLLAFLPAASIEELIFNSMGAPRIDAPAYNWPVIINPASEQDLSQPATYPMPEPAVPGPLATAAFEQVGEAIANYSTVDIAPQLVAAFAGIYQQWSAAADSSSAVASTLQLRESADLTLPEPSELDLRVVTEPWCVPQVLFDQLQQIAQHPNSAIWAEQTISQLHALTERERPEGEDVQTILAALSDATQEARRMAEDNDEDRLRVALLRAHWGLARRLDRWAVVHDIRVAEQSRQRVAARGELGQYFDGDPNETIERSDTLALTTDLENYEQNRDPRLARDVVRQQHALASSPDSLDRALADAVEQHYRNANIRIAITSEMLNRFAGQERSEIRPLRDRIAGTPVRGSSHTQSQSHVRLEPTNGSWQMELEAHGVVDSDTLADGGQAQLRSLSATDFAARKRVVVDSQGVVLQPAFIDVSSRNRLVGVTTDFDWVPLFGSFARDRAAQQYRARQMQARMEVESRVSNQAVEEIDEAVIAAVDRIEKQVKERFTGRLADAGIKVTPVEMTTTPERVVARLRVAGDEQLGSHTPRPRALSDSLASLQVHETALTNAAVCLELNGRQYTADELQAMLRQKFPKLTLESTEAHQDTVFRFAAEDAMQFHVNDGKLEVTLALKGVELEGRTIRNFMVHAYYVPAVNGLNAELVREGSLGIEGRLSSSQRARLHNVFNEVLPPERPLPLVQLNDPSDSRLAGLMITQLVLEDGWLGLAVGPSSTERVAQRSRSLR